MDDLKIFVERLEKIGIKLELTNNYPIIYLDKINGNRVSEKYQSEHGFIIAYLPIRPKQKTKFINIENLFNLIRKYKDLNLIMERFGDKIEKANSLGLTRFCFEVNHQMFYSEWRRLKWLTPIKIDIL